MFATFLEHNRSDFGSSLSELGEASLQSHRIETGDAMPVRQRFYRQSPQVKEEMNHQVDEMLKTDISEESHSMWQSPVVMVKKKNGQMRFAVDYRKLNPVTQQYSFPLSRLEYVFDAIGVKSSDLLDAGPGIWILSDSNGPRNRPQGYLTPT